MITIALLPYVMFHKFCELSLNDGIWCKEKLYFPFTNYKYNFIGKKCWGMIFRIGVCFVGLYYWYKRILSIVEGLIKQKKLVR